ncbi:MAG: hypothetical protein QM698_13930 [Micropepsaceae bacterium]
MTIWRVLAAILAAFHGLNGLRMIFDPAGWYASVPGIEHTGPLNTHFVPDIGFAFIVAAIGFGIWAARPRIAAWAVMGALWPALHGVFHIIGFTHHMPEGLPLFTEAGAVVLPGLIGLVVAGVALKRERNA